MKAFLRQLFSFILTPLERGHEPFLNRPMNRKILWAVSVLFSGLGVLVIFLLPEDGDPGYWFPAIIFCLLGATGMIVAALGNDRAVAKIWGNR